MANRSKPPKFNLGQYLETAGVRRRVRAYDKNEKVFVQGDPANSVYYLQSGVIKLSVTSARGKEAVVTLLHPGDFFGEGCVAGQAVRVSTATAMQDVSVLDIEKQEMIRVIHNEPDFSERFVAHMLKRNVRIEEDLVDQLFNSSEKRLARTLLLMARYGKDDLQDKISVHVSQETLAEMVGTTRSRVSSFMNKFRRLGFIKYNGGIQVKDSLLRVLLQD